MNAAELIDVEWRRTAMEWQRSLLVIEAMCENLVHDYEKNKDQLVIGLLFIRAQTGRLSESDKCFIEQHHLKSLLIELQKRVRGSI